MPFYNTSSIPNFYFPNLLIKIIYLRNKIYFFFLFFFQFSPPPSLNLYHRTSTAQSPPPRLHHTTTSYENPIRTKTHIKKKTHIVTHANQNAEPRPRRPSTNHKASSKVPSSFVVPSIFSCSNSTQFGCIPPHPSLKPRKPIPQTHSDKPIRRTHHFDEPIPQTHFSNPPLRKPIPQTHSNKPINRSQPTTIPRSNDEPNPVLVQALNEKDVR